MLQRSGPLAQDQGMVQPTFYASQSACRAGLATRPAMGRKMKSIVQFNLNGRPTSLDTDDDRMLLWVLRTDLALTGTKYGCGEGICGACIVEIGRASCRKE